MLSNLGFCFQQTSFPINVKESTLLKCQVISVSMASLYGSCDIKVGKPERSTEQESMLMRNLLDWRERKVLRMIFS